MKNKKPTIQYKIKSVELKCWGGEKFKHPNNEGGFELHWIVENVGFGVLTFIIDKEDKVVCSTECMSEKFVKAVLDYFFKNCVKYKD